MKKTGNAYQELSPKVALVGLDKIDQRFLSTDVYQSSGYVLAGTSFNLFQKSVVPIA